MIAASVHAFVNPIQDGRISLLWLALVLVLGLLMSSTVRYSSFKEIEWTRRRPSLAIVVLVLLIGGVVLFSQITLMVIASVYLLHGITMYVVRSVRHRLASHHA
jgi:phosphatidylserine synthase